MIVTLIGKMGNAGTDQVRHELHERCNKYMLVEQFEWARDEQCKDQAPHVDKDGIAHIQKMPTIHLHGSKEEIGKWLIQGPFKNPVTRWHYVGQNGDYWITGLADCLEFVRGADWRSA